MPNIDFGKKFFLNLEKNGLSQANVLWGDTIWKEEYHSYGSRRHPVSGFSVRSVTH